MYRFVFVAILASISSAHAGLRYSHLVFECINDDGVRIAILKPGPATRADSKRDLAGKMLVLNTTPNFRELGETCENKSNENEKKLKIKENGDFIGEDPAACKFELNKSELTATYEFRLWKGFVRGIFSRPEIHGLVTLTCSPRDEIVNW